MRKTKKTFFDILKEILSHIVLIAVALIVLLPIIYVISAGFRTNQAIYGPLVDVNTWVDTSIANRRNNKISKPVLKARMAMVFDGETKDSIENYEKNKKNKKYEAKSSESKAVLEKAFIMIDKNIRNLESKEYSDFIEAYENWKNSVSYDLAEQVQEQLFERYDGPGIDEHKFRYKYDVRTSLSNFQAFFTGKIPNADKAKYPMFQWMLNSIFVAGTVAIIQLIVVALAAYVLSRFRFNGKKESLMVLLTIQVFPGTMAMVALYLLLQYLGGIIPAFGIDRKIGLILIYLGGGLPFNIWMVKGYFDSIPKALEESATIDGATTWQSFTMIILPLVQPILAVATILSFVGQYNEFVLAAVVLNKQDNYTLPLGLRFFMNAQQDARFGVFSAASIVGSLPIVVLWLALQSRIISGLTGGAVKG